MPVQTSSRVPDLSQLNAADDAARLAATNPLGMLQAIAQHERERQASNGAPTVGGGGPLVCVERTFTETTGAGTYTATVAIPAGATVLDVIWRNGAVWTATTSATLNVGDDDDSDGYYAAVDLKTAPVADVLGGVGGLSTQASSTGSGDAAGVSGKFCVAARTLTATVVTVGAAGNAGRSRMLVKLCLPVSVAATKA